MSDEKEQVPTPNVGESNVGESNVGGSQDISMNIEITAISNESQSSMPNEMEANRRKQTSDVWNHFKRQKIEGKWKAICNYCGSKLLGEAKQGTTHLRNHFKSCKLRTTRDIRQAFLKTEKKGSETNLVGCFAFNQELARSALAKMIVAHEYPMAMVEHKFFKEFLSIVAPLFKGVTRNTIRSDIMKIYNEERENTMKLLSRNQEQSDHEIERVKAICQDLVKEYDTRVKGKETISSTPSVNPSVENVGDDTMKEEWRNKQEQRKFRKREKEKEPAGLPSPRLRRACAPPALRAADREPLLMAPSVKAPSAPPSPGRAGMNTVHHREPPLKASSSPPSQLAATNHHQTILRSPSHDHRSSPPPTASQSCRRPPPLRRAPSRLLRSRYGHASRASAASFIPSMRLQLPRPYAPMATSLPSLMNTPFVSYANPNRG
ncbi:Zinc finger, BED-type [Sesbania bispinosa]|nr:Zinc finger, BED-type [Sesbania bispinosa]